MTTCTANAIRIAIPQSKAKTINIRVLMPRA